MEELADKNNSPLKDSEIARLIDVSNNAGYKKQESIPARNLIDFKPKSLLEIALKEDNTEKKIDPQPGSSISHDELVEENQRSEFENIEVTKVSENQNSDPNETKDLKPEENQEPDEGDVSQASSQDTSKHYEEENGIENITSEGLTDNQNEANKTLETNETETRKNEIDPLLSAKQEGIEIGKKMAMEATGNNLTEASKTLHSVIESLRGKDVLDKTNLMNSILTTIMNIACERAGQIIEEHPKSFTEKILAFIDEIDKSSKKVILNLNPHDAKLIGTSILEHFSENEIQIKENSDLFRGDSIVQIGSIEIGDIISERITFSSELKNNKKSEPEIPSESKISSNTDEDNEKTLSEEKDE